MTAEIGAPSDGGWWMIERDDEKVRPMYFCWTHEPGSKHFPRGEHSWTPDWRRGARFATKEAAEAHTNNDPLLHVRDHAMMAPSAGPSPGPWKIVPYGDGDSLVICEEDDNWRICFMATPGDSPHAWREIKANADLIASAPKLHAAVAAIHKVRDGYASQMRFCDIEALGYFREFVRRIDTALASAMSAGTAETEGLRAKPASAVPQADAQP